MSEITEPKLDGTQEELVDGNQSIQNTTNNNEDLDDDDEKPSSARERRKIEIRFIQDKSRRHITFSKRKAGIMKKAYELSVLTGTQVLLLVVSETGLVYTFTTPKLQPLVTKPEGKNLIQACLNAPEESGEDEEASTPTNSQSQQASQAPQSSNQQQQSSQAAQAQQQAQAQAQAQQQQQAVQAQAQAQHQAQAQQPHPQNPNQPPAGSGYPQQPGLQNLPPNSGYLNPEQAAVYQTYFGNINNQQGQY